MTMYCNCYNSNLPPGGDANRTVRVEFLGGSESVDITQNMGPDAEGHMRLETTINGNVPNIDPSARVRVDDYDEEFRTTGAGTSLLGFCRQPQIIGSIWRYKFAV